jgi:hypothetical protein
MAHFIISYDLHNQRHYQPVWDKLESWGAVRLLESLWVATLNNTAGEVRDALKLVVDKDDSIAVIELKKGSGWGTWNGKKPGVDWLKANIS